MCTICLTPSYTQTSYTWNVDSELAMILIIVFEKSFWSLYVAQISLQLMILLPHASRGWDYRHVSCLDAHFN